jgi:hypothetical protein
MPNPAHHDGCTFWPDLWYRACCDAHDLAYATGSVETQTHIDLGMCVIRMAPDGLALVAAAIGALMTIATKLWWLVKHSHHK